MFHRFLGPTSSVFDARGLGWGPRLCLSTGFPGDADAVGQEPHWRTTGLVDAVMPILHEFSD